MVTQVFQWLEAVYDVFNSQIVGCRECPAIQFGRQPLRALPNSSCFKRIRHCFLAQIFLRKQHSDLRPNLFLILSQQGRRCLSFTGRVRGLVLEVHIIQIPSLAHKSNNNKIYAALLGFSMIFGFFGLFVTYTPSIN